MYVYIQTYHSISNFKLMMKYVIKDNYLVIS